MAVYTTYTDNGAPTVGGGGNYAGSPVRTVLTNVFESSRRNLASTDSVSVLAIPAGTWIESVFLEIITPNAVGGQTISVGDVGGTLNGWVVNAATDAAAGTKVLGASTGYAMISGTGQANGRFYSTASALCLESTSGSASTTGKYRVSAVCTII